MKFKLFKKIFSFTFLFLILYTFIFSTFIFANDYSISLLDVSRDSYISFGTPDSPAYQTNGITLDIDHTSISFNHVDFIMRTENNLIESRNINKFIVTFNNRIVEVFYPSKALDWKGDEIYSTFYKLNSTYTEFTNGWIDIQVIGVYEELDYDLGQYVQYAVAWSEKSEAIRLKPFPVIDRESIWWLSEIWLKLEELLMELKKSNNLLTKISDQLKTMFTPTPQAQSRLDSAAESLMEKMPMKEMTEQSEEMSNKIKNTKGASAGSQKTIGPSRDYFLIGVEFELFDFTKFTKEMELMRRLLQAVIWIEFFMFILFYLAPKLDI